MNTLRRLARCWPLVRGTSARVFFFSGGTPFGISPQTRGGALTRLIPPDPPRTPPDPPWGGSWGGPSFNDSKFGGVWKNPKISYPFLVVSGPPFFDPPGGPILGSPPDFGRTPRILAGPPQFWDFWGALAKFRGGSKIRPGGQKSGPGEKLDWRCQKNFRGRSQNFNPEIFRKILKKIWGFSGKFRDFNWEGALVGGVW